MPRLVKKLTWTTATLASYITALKYEDPSPAALHMTKKLLIDALGCAVGDITARPR